MIDVVKVTDFETCVLAGKPVIPIVPGECNHRGKSYFEEIIIDDQVVSIR